MSNALKEIKDFIGPELKSFQKSFRASMSSKVPLLDRITYYIVKSKGKQMRPMFVFLSAKCFGEINESSYRAASLVELLHTATLVHDDVVDDANQRRGMFSINALWKNKIAVLVGDYLLSKGLLLALNNEEYQLLQIVSTAVKEMSEGELLQIEKARKLDIDESIYFDIIGQKTASLIASACSAGVASVSSDPKNVEKMREFGSLIGTAFQLKDDLFDYGSNMIGKPVGIDIKEKKMTLPLIYALNQSSASEKRRIIRMIKYKNKNKSAVKEVIKYVHASGGIEYAEGVMMKYRERAFDLLKEIPNSESKDKLMKLVDYVVKRKK